MNADNVSGSQILRSEEKGNWHMEDSDEKNG